MGVDIMVGVVSIFFSSAGKAVDKREIFFE